MTPNDLEVLIHCYVSPERHPRIDAPAVREAIKKFIRDGIIDERHRTTEKGEAWLELILRVPYPKKAYVDEEGKVIRYTP